MKILSSFLTGLFFLCVAATSQAAIVFTDYGEEGYSPELTIQTGSITAKTGYFYFDFSAVSDSLTETPLIKYQHRVAWGTTNITVSLYNLYYVGENESHAMSYLLQQGVCVGTDSDWVFSNSSEGVITDDYSYFFYYNDGAYGGYDTYWDEMEEGETGYLGFAFDYEDTRYYGWAEIYLNSETGEITVYGYAYDDSGAAILTGDTGGSTVPVPGTILLLSCGLLGITGLGRKANKC